RISVGSVTPIRHSFGWIGQDASGLKPERFSLLSDYYFSTGLTPPGATGGFRATSGFVAGPSAQHWIDQPGLSAGRAISLPGRLLGPNTSRLPNGTNLETTTLPYFGIGYTGLSPRGGWSFSADLGMMAQSQSVRFGRALGGSPSLDTAIRDLRFAPILQFGVSYSF
ncbi:MAG: hypothetical protein ABIP61_09615, partial [Burkholderiaceae bacterium]